MAECNEWNVIHQRLRLLTNKVAELERENLSLRKENAEQLDLIHLQKEHMDRMLIQIEELGGQV